MGQGKKSGREKEGFATEIGKAVSGFASKTQEAVIHAVDKNGDGKFDRSDIGLTDENLQAVKERADRIATVAEQGLKDGEERISKAIADMKLDKEKKALRPVFEEEFGSLNRSISVIRVVEHDKRRSESAVCAGSIGYWESVKGVETLCIYDDCTEGLGILLHPSASKGIYYAEPYHKNWFIVLNEYFNFIKKARVNELEVIAQKLGAKRVQISFKEQDKKSEKKGFRSQGKVEASNFVKGSFSGTHQQSGNESLSIEIATDLVFSGHDHPERPELVYFKNESDIEKLIQMRTGNNENKIQSKTYRFQCRSSSGISENDAAEIDAIVKQLKGNTSVSFSNEIQRENRTELEYKIEF